MNYLCLLSLFFILNCAPLPEPLSPLQKFSSFAKTTYGDVRTYFELVQEKLSKAKDFFVEKVRNISKRGEPMYKEEESDQMPELSEAELKELFGKLFKDMNLGDTNTNEAKEDFNENNKETKERSKEEERAL